MIPTLKSYKKLGAKGAVCLLGDSIPADLSKEISKSMKPVFEGQTNGSIRRFSEKSLDLFPISGAKEGQSRSDHYRAKGGEAYGELKKYALDTVWIHADKPEDALAFAEGLFSANYRFDVHKSDKDDFVLKSIALPASVDKKSMDELAGLFEAIVYARNLVNEPANILTAAELAKRVTEAGKKGKYKVEVFGKAKIKSLKMGGLLSVNQGSAGDPAFIIAEYRPKKPVNKKPIVLVGKGIVYDTGGLSLKPTPDSMDIMKSDMAGAAAVAAAVHAAALNELPVHVVALIPATNNAIGPDAYAPGDVITMYDGTTVEVMNTDAEGRLVLADALTYAKKYDPEVVIDLATLTGAAMRALGYHAAAAMATADESAVRRLEEAGEQTGERVVNMPLWDVYGDELRSDVADLRNLGKSPLAGAIVAGKFLQHFTDYPWIHIDIAGPSFLPSAMKHLPKGATGFGTKLMYEFMKNSAQ
ncbi:MAG TPA: leucyl aminopeptidase [Cryomorphaceae bacterium]|nr:leucyl aminopeptidase [Cryomorphaceae bacterium]